MEEWGGRELCLDESAIGEEVHLAFSISVRKEDSPYYWDVIRGSVYTTNRFRNGCFLMMARLRNAVKGNIWVPHIDRSVVMLISDEEKRIH